MIIIDSTLTVEHDTGHVVFVFRWNCCTCGTNSCWLDDDTAAKDLAADHAATHT